LELYKRPAELLVEEDDRDSKKIKGDIMKLFKLNTLKQIEAGKLFYRDTVKTQVQKFR
jgi:hypothetical protein